MVFKTEERVDFLGQLPPEISFLIISFLNSDSNRIVALVSRTWYSSSRDILFWMNSVERTFPFLLQSSIALGGFAGSLSFFENRTILVKSLMESEEESWSSGKLSSLKRHRNSSDSTPSQKKVVHEPPIEWMQDSPLYGNAELMSQQWKNYFNFLRLSPFNVQKNTIFSKLNDDLIDCLSRVPDFAMLHALTHRSHTHWHEKQQQSMGWDDDDNNVSEFQEFWDNEDVFLARIVDFGLRTRDVRLLQELLSCHAFLPQEALRKIASQFGGHDDDEFLPLAPPPGCLGVPRGTQHLMLRIENPNHHHHHHHHHHQVKIDLSAFTRLLSFSFSFRGEKMLKGSSFFPPSSTLTTLNLEGCCFFSEKQHQHPLETTITGSRDDDYDDTFASLKSLRRATLSNCGLVHIPKFLLCSRQLEYLNLTHNEICGIREISSSCDFDSFVSLRTLLLEDNPISSFELEIFFMPNLQVLSLPALPFENEKNLADAMKTVITKSQLKDLKIHSKFCDHRVMMPQNDDDDDDDDDDEVPRVKNDFPMIQCFPELKEFAFCAYNFSIPIGIEKCLSLVNLNLSQTRIEALPSSFGDLKRLKNLDLSESSISSLPDSFCDLIGLQTLNLAHCKRLNILPNNFGRLQDLELLDLNSCVLKSLPISFCELKSLTFLSLEGNPICALRVNFGRLLKLKRFFFARNQMTVFPKCLSNLRNLTELVMDHSSKLEHLNNFSGMPALKTLQISENSHVESVPESISDMKSLIRLHLSSLENLKSLPKNAWSSFSRLEELRLDYGRLQQIPNSFGELKNLRILVLRGNRFARLPNCLSSLNKKLTCLDLGENKFNTFPSVICTLRCLKLLNISRNNIRVLPSTIGSLTHLTELDVSGNTLEELPATISRLKNLRQLFVHANSFRRLPERNVFPVSLSRINIDDNDTLCDVPISLFDSTIFEAHHCTCLVNQKERVW